MSGGGRLWRHADHLSALDTGPMLNICEPESVTTVRPPRTDAPQSGHSKPAVRRDERAVSKVVGVVLLIAIVIALAAVIAGMVSGFSGQLQEPAPQAAFEFTHHDDVANPHEEFDESIPSGADEVLVVEHIGGETMHPDNIEVITVFRNAQGDEVVLEDTWEESTTGSDGQVHATGKMYPYTGNEYSLSRGQSTVVWHDPDSDNTYILAEWNGPENA